MHPAMRRAAPKQETASPAGAPEYVATAYHEAGTSPRTATQFLREHRWLIALLTLAFVVRVATLGAYPLMDNTEARYAEIARKIVETGDWATPQFRYGVPFWSKPPLSMWLTAIAYLGLGINEFTARLPSLLVCFPVAWITYDLATRRFGPSVGLRAAVVLVSTPLFFVSAGAVMTDPALVLGTTLSMAGFWQAVTRTDRVARIWGYMFFVGLAIGLLAKGPVALVLTFAPIVFWTLWRRRVRTVWERVPWISGLLLMLALSIPWYVLAETRTPGFLNYFIVGEHWKRFTESGWKGDMFGSAHARPRGTIWLFAFAATLPWSALWILLWYKNKRGTQQRFPPARDDDGWHAYLWIWMLASPVFFTFAGNILFTYVLPGLPAFALLVAERWNRVDEANHRGISMKLASLAIPVGSLIGILLVVPQLALTHSHKALVAEYRALRASDAERLVYLVEAPHSAEFYARGQLTTAATAADLDLYLHDSSRDFFVLSDRQLDAAPAIRERLIPVERFGRYTLLRETNPGSAATR